MVLKKTDARKPTEAPKQPKDTAPDRAQQATPETLQQQQERLKQVAFAAIRSQGRNLLQREQQQQGADASPGGANDTHAVCPDCAQRVTDNWICSKCYTDRQLVARYYTEKRSSITGSLLAAHASRNTGTEITKYAQSLIGVQKRKLALTQYAILINSMNRIYEEVEDPTDNSIRRIKAELLRSKDVTKPLTLYLKDSLAQAELRVKKIANPVTGATALWNQAKAASNAQSQAPPASDTQDTSDAPRERDR